MSVTGRRTDPDGGDGPGTEQGVTALLRPIGPAPGAGRPADDVTVGAAGIGARRRGGTAQREPRMPPASEG